MTTIEDTLTYADGSLASGRLVVYWEGFTVANVQAAGGMLDYEIVDGRVSVSLYANAGAQPTGSYYNAKYELENGKVYVEQWIVPNLPMVNLGQVRVSFPPTPSVMISPTQLTSLNATPGQFLQWDGVRWVPTYISTLNVQPNTINLVVDGTGSDVTVDGSPVALGSTMTLHMPDAGPTARGVVNSGDQMFAGNKTFQGMTTFTNVTVTGTVTLPPGSYVPVTRRILGDVTIAGGGDLSADRTLSVVPDTSLQRVSAVNNQNVPLATRPQLYFDGGVNFNIAVTDNVAGNRIDIAIGPAGGATGLVISVFGRSGVVTAQTGDYTAAQVTNAVSVLGSYANPVWITSLAWSKITGVPATGVSSVFGRAGAVVAVSGDYSAAQVTNAVDQSVSYANPVWITSLAWSKITGAPATVPPTRSINTSTGLTGGGDLSADRTLSVVPDTTVQRVQAALAGIVVGARPQFNFIAGAGQTINVVDNAAANRIDITINTSGSGPATPSIYSVNGAVIGTRAQLNLISGSNVTLAGVDNSGANRVDITITAMGAVASVFGRSGAVVAVAGDYTAAQVTNAVDSTGSYANPVWITSLAWSKVTGAPAFLTDPLTTKGDLLARSTSTTRLPVGADGQVLTVDSTQALGLKWGPAGGAASQTPWASDIDAAGFTLKNAGKVGIGTSVPALPLHVTSTAASYPRTAIFENIHSSVQPTDLILRKARGTPGALVAILNGDLIGTIESGGYDGSVYTVAAQIAFIVSGAIAANSVPTDIVLYTGTSVGGSERMRITAAGNVGVGNTGPVPYAGATNTLIVGAMSTVSGQVTIATSLTGAGGGIGGYSWSNYAITATEKRIAQVGAATGTTIDSGDILFYTWNAGVAGERMRITAAGSVGVGMTPTYTLDVKTTGAVAIRISNSTTANNNLQVRFFGANANTDLWAIGTDIPTVNGSKDFQFYDLTTGRLPLVLQIGTGNVGIGATPGGGERLSVLSNDNVLATNILALRSQNGLQGIGLGYSAIRQLGAGAPLSIDSNGAGVLSLQANGGTGNVGIGTTNPGALLGVVGGSLGTSAGSIISMATLQFSDLNVDQLKVYGYRNAAGSDWNTGEWRIQRKVDTSDMAWVGFPNQDCTIGTGATERMRITSGGNVGVGTASPQVPLHVVKVTSIGASPPAAGTYGGPVIISNDSLTYGMYIGSIDNGYGYIQQQRGDSAVTYPLLLQPNGGNVGIGVTNPLNVLHVRGAANHNIGLRSYNGRASIGAFSDAGAVGPLGFDANQFDFSGGKVGIGTTNIPDVLTVAGDNIRLAQSPYGVVFRNDGNSFYLLTTNSGDPYGTWKSPFPIAINLATCGVSLGAGLTVTGNCNITGQYQVNGVPFGGGITTQNLVGGSRSLNVAYQNATGKPMFVSVAYQAIAQGAGLTMKADAANPPNTIQAIVSQAGNSGPLTVACWVLPGHYYSVSAGGSFTTQYTWTEWY
jgi:hypothetical protein